MFIRDLSWAADRLPKEDEVPYGPYNRLEDVYSACEVVSFACIVRLEHRTGKKVKHG